MRHSTSGKVVGKATEKGNGSQACILIADEDDLLREQLAEKLSESFKVLLARDRGEAERLFHAKHPGVVMLSAMLDGQGNGYERLNLLQKFTVADPSVRVIMVSEDEDPWLGCRALQLGAHDFYQKPVDVREFRVIVDRATYLQKLRRTTAEANEWPEGDGAFEGIVGKCVQMQEVFSIIRRIGPTEATVLITGESGTGKELVARAIHARSHRKTGPFVAINCGAIPDALLESELFGHEKGAFTGADVLRKGKLEAADEGTVFLDEIGELNPSLQVKILRFLQDKEIERVGGRDPIPLNVRIIAATNKDLDRELESGGFRSDLFYRLSVIGLVLPPLRQRGEDVLLLANHFLRKFSADADKPVRGFSGVVKRLIQQYRWPGNVRELENKMKRAVILASHSSIDANALGIDLESGGPRMSLRKTLDEVEARQLRHALRRNRGNVSRAARDLEVNRSSFYDLLKKHKITRNEFR